MERVRAAMALAPCIIPEQNLTIPVTLSFGVAVSLEDAESADGLLAAADKRLYDAKNGGRDRVCVEGYAAHFREGSILCCLTGRAPTMGSPG